MFVAGETIYVSELDTFGIVIESNGKTVNFYGKNGKSLASLHEVARSNETLEENVLQFKRLYLPYGKWVCKDGTEVLFNRDYCAMWAKSPSGEVSSLAPDTWVVFESESFFYNESVNPDHQASLKILEVWGISEERPETLKRLFESVKTNDYDLVSDKNCDKKFYGSMTA